MRSPAMAAASSLHGKPGRQSALAVVESSRRVIEKDKIMMCAFYQFRYNGSNNKLINNMNTHTHTPHTYSYPIVPKQIMYFF